MLGVRRWTELLINREKWRGIVRQAKAPQRAVAPMEEEEVGRCVVADISEELAASNFRIFQEE